MILQKIDGSKKIHLKQFDPEATGGVAREEADARFHTLGAELEELQNLLYAAQQTPLLVVMQGMDTSGKDGTIRNVIGFLNPQSCSVASFKVPTPLERAHDFLWRVHAEVPSKGKVVIFNRSHYEDVLVVRVHNLVPQEVWQKHYEHINNFEKLLADSGAIILKFFLHITKEEQEKRLIEREKDPTKAWKLSAADWTEREHWNAYQEAYEEAINRCATPHAPWHIVPANKKWYRNLLIAEAMVEAMRPLRAEWLHHLQSVGTEELKTLRAMRQSH